MRLLSFSTAAGTAHTNSTTETSIAQKLFAADELVVGKAYEWEVLARATSTNSTDTLTMRVRYGTSATVTSNTSCAATGAVDAVDDDIHTARVRLYIASATRHILTIYTGDPDAEGITAVEQYSEIFTATADTAYYLDVSADWSVAHADNSVQSEVWNVRVS